MDRETWIVLDCAVKAAVRRLPRPRRRFQYSDRIILMMWLWAVMHDRPMSWACSRSSYNGIFRPRGLPSVSQFSKRIKTERFDEARRILHGLLTGQGREDLLCFFDGKPLVIGEYSTDPDARDGIAAGRYRKGYKLHARTSQSGFFLEYTVLPLNEGEPNTARGLIEALTPGSLSLADANFDSAPLYNAVHERDGFLLTPLKGRATNPRRLAEMGEARRAAIRAWETMPELCEQAMHQRDAIERHFGNLTSFGGGLGPLPAWVRTLPRVRRWVDAKIAIYHARLIARRTLASAA
jgi:hypothetical protein